MAFMKFSENRKEAVSDITDAGSECGDRTKKIKLKTKIKLGFLVLCIVIISVITVTVHIRNKMFEDAVDKFCEDWEKLNLEMDRNEPDALQIDVRYQILSADMKEISKHYGRFKSKVGANKYLENHIDQYMFHEITHYNEQESSQPYQFCDELYEFYKNPTRYLGLEFSNIEFYVGADGFIHCRGSVVNNGAVQVYAAVKVYFRDKEGNVIKYDKYGLISDKRLNKGESKEFDFNSNIREGIVSCDMVMCD